MFWKHFAPPVSELDNILEREDCTLIDILDSDDVLQECKGLNDKLLSFLALPENIEKLVRLVVSEPEGDSEEPDRFKHSNVACNILTSGPDRIVDAVVTEEALLGRLFAFVEGEAPLNSLLASFFSRVAIDLFTRRGSILFEYVSSRPGLVDKILSHIGTSAIMDVLLGIVGSFQMVEDRQMLCEWAAENGVVSKLVDSIGPRHCPATQYNAARVLTEMHRCAYEFLSMNCEEVTQDSLLEALESKETVTRLLQNAMASGEALRHVPDLLCAMVTLQQAGTPNSSYLLESVPYANVGNEDATHRLADCIVPFMSDIVDVLRKAPSQAEAIRSCQGETFIPLGCQRLGLIKLIVLVLQVTHEDFNLELVRLKVALVLLDLFFAYPWNSFLHTCVEQFINCTLGQLSDVATEMQHALVVDGRLLQRLAAAGMENELAQAKLRLRRGYMGHLVGICNAVLRAVENSNPVRDMVAAIDTDELDEWRSWLDGPLESVNELNSRLLGGSMPSMVMSMSESDDDVVAMDVNGKSSSSQAHDAVNFFATQPMAGDFTEMEPSENAMYEHSTGIGFGLEASTDDGAGETMFEAACAQRLTVYSSDSDDEADGESSATTGVREEVPRCSSADDLAPVGFDGPAGLSDIDDDDADDNTEDGDSASSDDASSASTTPNATSPTGPTKDLDIAVELQISKGEEEEVVDEEKEAVPRTSSLGEVSTAAEGDSPSGSGHGDCVNQSALDGRRSPSNDDDDGGGGENSCPDGGDGNSVDDSANSQCSNPAEQSAEVEESKSAPPLTADHDQPADQSTLSTLDLEDVQLVAIISDVQISDTVSPTP